jgi:hypothetical protein
VGNMPGSFGTAAAAATGPATPGVVGGGRMTAREDD